MNILALDTSMGACSAALLRADGGTQKICAREETMARGHAEALMPMVASVMQEANTPFAALDLIAATTGPGTFTGVRIAIAAARGLALVTKAKLFGTDSLTVMARAALADSAANKTPLAVAVDARRGMIYFGLYDAMGNRLRGPLLLAPEEAVAALPHDLHGAIGSGAMLLAEAAVHSGRTIDARLPDLQPSAAALAEIALETREPSPNLRPLYLRPPDAKPQLPPVELRQQ
jgi:tRNA threonylcarbamoyladenosine biosynthesis protein TsaB